MKPKSIYAAFAIVIALCLVSTMNFNKARTVKRPPVDAPKGYSEAFAKKLQEAGFTANENVTYMQTKEHRDYWQKTFGLNFIGDVEIQKFLHDNDFIMGETTRYLGEMPQSAFVEMNKNLEMVRKKYAPFVKFSEIDNDFNGTFMFTDGGGVTGWSSSLSWSPMPSTTREFTYDVPTGVRVTELVDGTVKTERVEKGKSTIIYDTLPLNSEVWIIAAKAKFNTEGMQLEGRILRNPPTDPIALVKVKSGYVELANWE